MHRFCREHLADDSLLDHFHASTGHEQEAIADVIADMAEILRRRLYARLGFPSMKSYCVRVRNFSEDAAAKRIQVARKALLLPVILEALAEGRVHLSGMNLLAPFLDEENVDELLAAATHRSKTEIELLLAERFPAPEAEEGMEEVAARSLRDRCGVRPLAPGRYLVQFTVSEPERERLQYALELMSHRNPRGSLAMLNRQALELLIGELEQEKFGATDEPRERPGSRAGRHVPAAVKRQVWARDGGRCTYVSPAGRRCESRWMLEFDHVQEFARGGEATADNLRLLCRCHNQYAAECSFGPGSMEEKRTRGSDAKFVNAPGHLREASGADAPGHLGEARDADAPGHLGEARDADAPPHLREVRTKPTGCGPSATSTAFA